MEIAGKVAIVTGAGAGIGRATALALGAKGARVVVADVDAANAAATARAVIEAGGKATSVGADVSSADGIRSIFSRAIAAYDVIDIVHNNAGIIGGEPLWPDSPLDRIAKVIAVNLGGVAMGTQAAIAAMRGRGGVIVNTASTAALAPMPTDPVYSATKVAVVRIVESCVGWADSDGIRVNAVLPGIVDTDMTMKHTGDGTRPAKWLEAALAGRTLLQPSDVAAAVLSLIEDDTKVGECLVVKA